MSNVRHQIDQKHFDSALEGLRSKLQYRMKQKGLGSMASCHEILGILTDELEEYRDEVHGRGTSVAKVEELLDIAVGCIFGIASITSGGVDW